MHAYMYLFLYSSINVFFACMYRYIIICPIYITTKQLQEGKTKDINLASPSGNRTPVFRVTGGDTVHYTNEDWLMYKSSIWDKFVYVTRAHSC